MIINDPRETDDDLRARIMAIIPSWGPMREQVAIADREELEEIANFYGLNEKAN